jgi:hypothetical protein
MSDAISRFGVERKSKCETHESGDGIEGVDIIGAPTRFSQV